MESWVSRVCEEFTIPPTEALKQIGFRPKCMPCFMVEAVIEVRTFLSVHREFKDIMDMPASQSDQAGKRRMSLQQHPMYKYYEECAIREKEGH